jgi:hypothetical protein
MSIKDPVICIPRIERDTSIEYIKKIFMKLQIGEIIKITETPLKSDNDYKRVFIKIKWNLLQPGSNYMHDRLNSGDNLKIVYEMPWYWKIVASR